MFETELANCKQLIQDRQWQDAIDALQDLRDKVEVLWDTLGPAQKAFWLRTREHLIHVREHVLELRASRRNIQSAEDQRRKVIRILDMIEVI